jgi:polygalacturonase
MKKLYLVLLIFIFIINAKTQAQSAQDSIAMVNNFKITMSALPVLPAFRNDTIDISTKQAVGDGSTLNTVIINNAIDELSKRGGGVVLIPRGVWLTGPVELKSNINLHLNKDAVLLFTKDKNQYKLFVTEWEGHRAMRNQSPLYGKDLENIAITGGGVIDGNGDAWRAVKKSKLSVAQWDGLVRSGGIVSADGKTWYPSASYLEGENTKDAGIFDSTKKQKYYTSMKDFFRPNLLVLENCKNILLEKTTFQNSPAWCLHLLMCKNITVKNIQVNNPYYAQNGDGIDVESCSNVLIEGSSFATGDDGICMKSGRDGFGRERNMPTQNVIVRNNIVYHSHGGFVIGSEMSGGVHDIFVYDNSFIGSDNGLRFKTVRGRGGVVSNVYVYNIRMKNIVHDAILFDMHYQATSSAVDDMADSRPEPVTVATPQFQDFKIENVVCDGAARGIFIRGLPEMNVKNVLLKNIKLDTKKAIEIVEATNIQLDSISLKAEANSTSLIDIRNVENVSFNNIQSDDEVENVFSVSGKKNKSINISNINVPNAKNKSL